MRFYLHLILVGVGALIPLGTTAVSIAEPVSSQFQHSGRVAQASPAPSPAQPAPKPNPILAPEPVIEPLGKPIGPAKQGPAPEYLNPVPNPLAIPTKPEEVKLQGIQPISLKQALELAERNNLNYQTARLQLEQSQAALRQAQAELYPTLNVQANVTRSTSAGAELAERASSFFSANGDEPNRGFTGAVVLNYDLFTSGRRPAQIRAAEQQVRSSQLQLEATREQLRLDITNAYYDLQQADAQVRIGQAAVRNAQISLRDAQALERAGIGTRFDVLRAQVQLANSQQQLTNARAQQQVNRRQLAQRLNISPAIDLAAADPVEMAGKWSVPLENSIVLAFKNRAELERQLSLREAARQQRKAALAGLGPTLNVSAQYQIQDDFADQFGLGDGYVVQAGVRWTLFDGGLARSVAAQREADIAIAETQFAELRNQVRFQVEQAYSGLLANQENITTAEKALEQAKEALRLARLRFQAGVGTQTDVINAETDLTSSQGNLVTAILGYNRALASLQRAVTNLPIPTGQVTPPLPPTMPPAAAGATP